MFDIGFWEIVLITVVALLVVGPNEFPALVRNLGRGMGKVRRFLSSVKSDLDFEIDKANEIKQRMEKETEITKLNEIIEKNAAGAVPVKGKSADAPKVEESDGLTQAESDQKPAQPVSDRRQT
jgi:sec-independent protein translocase protein TatB